jgi:hypothetical protein
MKYYSIVPEKKLIIYRPFGILTGNDIIDYIKNVVADESFSEGLLEFIDLSQVKEWNLGHQDVEKVTFFDFNGMGTIKKISKSAIWAPSSIAFGMARMYQSFAEKYNDKIYISMELQEALDFLGVTSEDIRF